MPKPSPCSCHGARGGVIIRFALPGFPHYPGAPAEVSFPADRHRHLFHFELTFQVSHDNRDLEFFLTSADAQRYVRGRFQGGTEPCEFGARSCEMIARDLFEHYAARGCVRVEVWEDGENGG